MPHELVDPDKVEEAGWRNDAAILTDNVSCLWVREDRSNAEGEDEDVLGSTCVAEVSCIRRGGGGEDSTPSPPIPKAPPTLSITPGLLTTTPRTTSFPSSPITTRISLITPSTSLLLSNPPSTPTQLSSFCPRTRSLSLYLCDSLHNEAIRDSRSATRAAYGFAAASDIEVGDAAAPDVTADVSSGCNKDAGDETVAAEVALPSLLLSLDVVDIVGVRIEIFVEGKADDDDNEDVDVEDGNEDDVEDKEEEECLFT